MNTRERLAKTLMAEAGGEGLLGMLAAGSVINNRAKTSGYGKGIDGVIMKPGQFSAWNGVTGYAKGQGALDMQNMRPSKTAYQATDALLSGNYEDPTGGATHYYNPSVANPKWGQRAGGEWQTIGNHIFGSADAGRTPSQQIANDTMQILGKEPQMASTQTQTRHPVAPFSQSGRRSTTRSSDEGREMAGGLFGRMFPNMTADQQDRLTIGLSGLSMNPNQMLMDAAKDRLADRRQARKGKEQRNRTAEWLMTQPGGEQYAQAIASGALPAGQALQMWQKASQGQAPVKGVEINGQLVNPVTGQQMGDYRSADGGSAKDQSIARIKTAYGVDDQTAVGIVDGVLNVSRDPYDQTVMVTNLATGQSYKPQVAQQPQQEIPAPSGIEQTALPPVPDASNGFGLEGMAKGAINSAADFIGTAPPFEGVQRTQSDFAVLREGLVNDISQGYGRQPPSWLMKNIQDLTPQAGGMMGPEAAQSKLGALQRSFENELTGIQQQMQGRIAPQQQRVLSERAASLQSALGKVGQALGQFGGSAGASTTRSGVQWRIEQ
jgi:Cell Wall Hydrolase